MQIRQHKGDLDESIATMAEIPATKVAVRAWALTLEGVDFDADELASITVRLYDENPDRRIPGWEKTYMIKYLPTGSKEMAVLGMCNEAVLSISHPQGILDIPLEGTPLGYLENRMVRVAAGDGGANYEHMHDMMGAIQRVQESVHINVALPATPVDFEQMPLPNDWSVLSVDSISRNEPLLDALAPAKLEKIVPFQYDLAWVRRNASIGARPSLDFIPCIVIEPKPDPDHVPTNRAERRSKKPKQHGAVHSVNKVEVKTSGLLQKLVGKKKV